MQLQNYKPVRAGLFILMLCRLMTGCTSAPKIKPDLNMITQQEISDRTKIQDLLTRYCFAVDDRDWDAYRKIFTTDAIIDDTEAGGFRSGVEEHATFMKKALGKILISNHEISPSLIEFKNGEAIVRTRCSCPMVLDMGNGKRHVFYQGLWYRTIAVRTPEGWRIKEHVEHDYWKDNMPEGFKF
ncbi:MAG: hypothetical protein JWR09_598 [Mucilaginibacter sp.]|nr:hypothetical protein [Mucilaginibacter sp.]